MAKNSVPTAAEAVALQRGRDRRVRGKGARRAVRARHGGAAQRRPARFARQVRSRPRRIRTTPGGSGAAPEPSPPQDSASSFKSSLYSTCRGVSDRQQLLVGAGLGDDRCHLVHDGAEHGNFIGIKGIGPETDEDIKAAIGPHMPGAAEAAEHVDGELDHVADCEFPLVRLTQPVVEPVTLAQAGENSNVRLAHSDDNDFLEQELIPAARGVRRERRPGVPDHIGVAPVV